MATRANSAATKNAVARISRATASRPRAVTMVSGFRGRGSAVVSRMVCGRGRGLGHRPDRHSRRSGSVDHDGPMAEPTLELRDVRLVRDGRTILDGVGWTVHPHERWVILGPNGSGKT